jgi:diguanylate cyclase
MAVAGGAAAVFFGALAVFLATRAGGTVVAKLVDDSGQLIAGILAATCCLVAAFRASGSRRAAWALLTAYCGIWAGSALIWLLFDISGQTQKPFSSIAAVGFVVAVPFAIVGSLGFSLRRGSRLPLLVRVLDAVTVAAALMLICWVPVLEHVFDLSRFGIGSELMSLGIPVGDLLVVTIIWSAISSSASRLRPSLIAVGVGFVSVTIADLFLAYGSANGTYTSGTVLDLFWTGGLLVLAAGAALEAVALKSIAAVDGPIAPRHLAIWVPFVSTLIAAAIALADFHGDGVMDPVTLVGVLAIMVLSTFRQLVVATANRRLIAMLGVRADTDSLTGLANRDRFRTQLEHALMPDLSAAGLLYVDIDNFKGVNDRFGHGAGDRVLAVLAQRLTGAMRPADLVARLGGDEFAILCAGATSLDDVKGIARRVQKCFVTPVAFGSDSISVSGSVGGAVAGPGDAADTALRAADVALYAAKERGRGMTEVYDETVHGAAISRMWLEADMAEGLERGQFTLLYQPTVRTATGKISGAEALVRWDHPVRGTISPFDFIPVAEASGFIVELGRWILRQALRDASGWRKDGAVSVISVNVTVQQLRSPGFVDHVFSALEETRMAPHDLILELTESAYVQDSASISAVVRALRERGIRIAIDDFGTGYSSLALLTKLDADILKIDRSFVVNATSQSGRLVLKTVIDLARALRLSTTVEGVETAEEATLVGALGADTIQGYYYDKPLAAEVFRSRIDPFAHLVPVRDERSRLLASA